MGLHIDNKWSELTQLTAGQDIPSETSVVAGAPQLGKKDAKKIRHRAVKKLAELQEALYAQAADGVLVVLQGLDTAGKDGTIRAVFGGVNPQGVKVHGFKVPTPEEAAHDYLYRIHQAVPARGEIGVFNRSHYEDLIVPLANRKITENDFMKRIDEIHGFERYLLEQKIKIVKLYLHVSYEEQGKRLLRRLENPAKHWKFSPSDLTTREHFSSFSEAYKRIIPATSFDELPWHIIPADQKWYRNSVASSIVTEAVAGLAPRAPEINIAHIARIRAELTGGLNNSSD
jgi:PPK2 family polyphosphate:nucleotide phosphotransferase